jgi:hypothetical protein
MTGHTGCPFDLLQYRSKFIQDLGKLSMIFKIANEDLNDDLSVFRHADALSRR